MRCDGFQQCGLAGAVLSDEKANPGLKPQFRQTANHRNIEWIVVLILHSLAQDCDRFEHRRDLQSSLSMNNISRLSCYSAVCKSSCIHQTLCRLIRLTGRGTVICERSSQIKMAIGIAAAAITAKRRTARNIQSRRVFEPGCSLSRSSSR